MQINEQYRGLYKKYQTDLKELNALEISYAIIKETIWNQIDRENKEQDRQLGIMYEIVQTFRHRTLKEMGELIDKIKNIEADYSEVQN